MERILGRMKNIWEVSIQFVVKLFVNEVNEQTILYIYVRISLLKMIF